MKLLRVSFLSGFALELIASLSVALIAVSIGLRLVDGSIALGTGLFILLLAPETFLPLRLVGANFHAASEGIAAAEAVFEVLESELAPSTTEEIKVDLLLTGWHSERKCCWLQQTRFAFFATGITSRSDI